MAASCIEEAIYSGTTVWIAIGGPFHKYLRPILFSISRIMKNLHASGDLVIVKAPESPIGLIDY